MEYSGSELSVGDVLMNYYTKNFLIAIFIIAAFFVHLHQKHSSHPSGHQVITVTSEPLTTTLFYTGIIQPVKLASITSLTDGIIEKMPFSYGDSVNQGQLLFIISSEFSFA